MASKLTPQQRANRRLVKRLEEPNLKVRLRLSVEMVSRFGNALEPHCNLLLRNILSVPTLIYEKAYGPEDPRVDYYRKAVLAIPSPDSFETDIEDETDRIFHKKLPDEFIYAMVRFGSNHGVNGEGVSLSRARYCVRFFESSKFDELLLQLDDLQMGRMWVAHASPYD